MGSDPIPIGLSNTQPPRIFEFLLKSLSFISESKSVYQNLLSLQPELLSRCRITNSPKSLSPAGYGLPADDEALLSLVWFKDASIITDLNHHILLQFGSPELNEFPARAMWSVKFRTLYWDLHKATMDVDFSPLYEHMYFELDLFCKLFALLMKRMDIDLVIIFKYRLLFCLE